MNNIYLFLLLLTATGFAQQDSTPVQKPVDTTSVLTQEAPSESAVPFRDTLSAAPADSQVSSRDTLNTAPVFAHDIPSDSLGSFRDSVTLSIQDALNRLFQYNPDIAEARALWISKQYSYSAAWGDFEPKLVGRYNKQSKGPEASNAPEIKEEFKLGVQGALITGTQYDVGFNQTNYEHSIEKSNLYFGATIKQPIARGVWFGSLWANQVLAKLDEKKSFQEYRAQLGSIIEKLLTAYWDYYYASKVLEFEKQSVDVAQSIFDDGVKRLQQGKLSRLELSKAYAELAIRFSRRLEALSMERDAKNELALLLADPNLIASTALMVNPDLQHLNDSLVSVASDDSLLLLNPQYLGQGHEIERLKVIKKAHIDQSLPSINLVGSYGISATNRSTEMAIETFKDPEFRDRVISGGVEIEMPLLGNHKERKTVSAANQSIRAAQIRQGLITQQITQLNQILSQRSIELQKQVSYERTAVKYHQDELTAEIIKLQTGKSNYRLVFDIEEKLREAQRKELEVTRGFELNLCKQQLNAGRLLLLHGLEKMSGANTTELREDLK